MDEFKDPEFEIDLQGKDRVIKNDQTSKKNTRLFTIAIAARNIGITDIGMLYAHMSAVNVTHCRPPLSDREVMVICESCLKHQEVSESKKAINSDEVIVWDKTKEGKFKNTYRNTINFFKSDDKLFTMFKHNEFSKRIELAKKPFWSTYWVGNNAHSDNDVMQIKQYLSTQANFEPSTQHIREAIQTVSFNHRYHPVKDYLDTLEWDGVPRVERFFPDYMHSDDTSYSRFLSQLIFCAAVKRIYHPGCEYHYMIIIEGKQGIGKSFALKAIGGPWFGEVPLIDRDKDTIDKMQGLLIIEVPELEVFKKKEVESLKNFLTNRIDRARLAYGHTTEEFPRQSIFVGTINPSENGYLRDTTGNRRFLPVLCEGDIDTQAIELTRDQFFAEAKVMLKNGFQIYVNKEMNIEALAQQELRLLTDIWESKIESFLSDSIPVNEEITTMMIFEKALRGDASRCTHSDQIRIAAILKKLGYKTKVVWKDSRSIRVYQRPTSSIDPQIEKDWQE